MCSQTLYPLIRFISCCMAELVSSTERRTLSAAYKELSSGAIATRLRTTAGPPTYRKPVDALFGVKVRTPERQRYLTVKLMPARIICAITLFIATLWLPKRPIRAAPMVRAVPLRCWLIFRTKSTGVEWSRDAIPICKTHKTTIIIYHYNKQWFNMDSPYLFSNQPAVYLIVILSDLHHSCQCGNCWIDAKWDSSLRDHPERERLSFWIVAWTQTDRRR